MTSKSAWARSEWAVHMDRLLERDPLPEIDNATLTGIYLDLISSQSHIKVRLPVFRL
jgi:hypothetical protein